ncbi:MAG: hypothetical protein COU11_01855 [Candidatus Harrisonbacteria bacterium CG10_big_fil_rev_8_21_14_0_10_49_15]|uniref:Sugar ABC transporter substrate-binding protein n=1 Tax=Candidatus Harrisonbacteria bacterium CG10_big_fil_rev_8_21_14_0_10_49_15 TaxID=1974587 RepID=A0A2H0ULE0_9BACT|nr:MAG: hypothetical protein COU11_01855 [Candidatus Harrisonbacteria bacterium CG10_big_fil_rev_8_21_14_0_10_49_15]
MRLSRIQIILIAVVLVAVLVVGLVFTCVIPGMRKCGGDVVGYQGELLVWGVFDSASVMTETLIADFTLRNPGVAVTYRQLDPRTYETELINALAAGTGPDVFMIHNTWLAKHGNKLFPLTSEQYPITELRDTFPEVVEQDLTAGGQVYALPLYIDSLALFYNRDILDAAGLARPPQTWNDFVSVVPRLRQLDSFGRLVRAAGAIGGSATNIDRASDLLSLMMLQYGTTMVNNSRTAATFANFAQPAVDFYASFARPMDGNYTWDAGFTQSVDAFSIGQSAMLFHYGYEIPLLKAKNPFLNFVVAPMIQANVSSPVNYASYWALGVSTRTADPAMAWALVFNSTLNPAAVDPYLKAAGRSPALRELIDTYAKSGGEASVFASQALSATSWYQPNPVVIDSIFSNLITEVVSGRIPTETALRQAQTRVTELLSGAVQ